MWLSANRRITMSRLLGIFFTLFILSSCTTMSVIENNNIEMENDRTQPDNIDMYLERERYSYNELDEMFYVIENNSNQKVRTIEFYTIEFYSDGEWVPQEVNQFWDLDSSIEILPNEKAEIPFWLPVDSTTFEPGDYIFRTRISYPEENDAADDMYMTFEIR